MNAHSNQLPPVQGGGGDAGLASLSFAAGASATNASCMVPLQPPDDDKQRRKTLDDLELEVQSLLAGGAGTQVVQATQTAAATATAAVCVVSGDLAARILQNQRKIADTQVLKLVSQRTPMQLLVQNQLV
jgi:hypothetical protein